MKNESDSHRYNGKIVIGRKIKAQYIPSDNPMYRHNPFIESLPPLFTDEEAFIRMRRYPAYTERDRLLAPLQRIDRVQSLSSYFKPLLLHLDLAQSVYRVIRNGYFARNPLTAAWKRQIASAYPSIHMDDDPDYVPGIHSPSAGFAFNGVSGIGKSIGIESVLYLFPQVIRHTEV